MLGAIIASLKSTFWAITLVLLVMYMFAVWFMQSALIAMEEDGASPEEFQRYWGSLDTSMYTLLSCMSGGQDWVTVVEPFNKYSLRHRALFSLYIVLVTLGMLNVLTGVFVTKAAELNLLDKDLVIQSEFARKKSLVKVLHDMFLEIDETRCGSVGTDQLSEYMSRPDVRDYMTAQQLHNGNFKQMIEILDPQKTGKVTMDQFIARCAQYKGNPRAIDIALMVNEQQRQSNVLASLVRKLDQIPNNSFEQVRFPLPGHPSNQVSTSKHESPSSGSAVRTPTPREEVGTQKRPGQELPNHVDSDGPEEEAYNVAEFEQTNNNGFLSSTFVQL